MVDWKEIDKKWQERWSDERVFKSDPDEDRPKFFLTVAYPYTSGPMHVGHARTYTVPDVIARYKRMTGYNVLFPMAWHLTGTPIVGASERVKNRDEDFLDLLTGLYGVEAEELPELEDPEYFGEYFAKKSDLSYKKGMNMLGYSIDWRREFKTIDESYKKFITWQYRKLMDMGLVEKGEHPVKWCPNDQNPVTDHDLLEGEGVSIVEYTLLKYRVGDYVLPAATLRPETIFGVTNLWLNPEVDYLVVDVDSERWVVSEEGLRKLRNQNFEIGEVKELEEELIGEYAEAPLIDKEVPILPATFVDPSNATGVVYSVPSHAPYDYIALKELQENPEPLEKFGIDSEEIREIEPISLIRTDDYGESPGVDVVEEWNISDQNDPKLEEATEEIYQKEFSNGIVRDWVPEYGGMKVSEAKERVHSELQYKNEGSMMYEFSEKPVICRCGETCLVKIVKDQWFLDYSEPTWKQKAETCLSRMDLVPEETRGQFEYTIDWLEEWPCTRKVGMGTPAPWDESWIIESLSDSTIYMIYYAISHVLKDIEPEKLTEEVFDYVFLGFGDPEELSDDFGIPENRLEEMRNQVEYWYPLDYRLSAHELISNHLTFHIFHHVALFPADMWPGGIVSLGMAHLDGSAMSSSKGNIVPINEATEKYGADAVRLYLMSGVEPWQDFDWQVDEAKAMVRHLDRFYSYAKDMAELSDPDKPDLDPADRWMLSRLQSRIRATTEALEEFETRKASQNAFFFMMKDLRWYFKRSEEGDSRNWILNRVLDAWVRLLSPIIPHACEEIWKMMDMDGFVSEADWPSVEETYLDETAEFSEEYVRNVMDDIKQILEVTDIEDPERIDIYVADDWRLEAYQEALEEVREGEAKVGSLMDSSKEEFDGVEPGCLANFFKDSIQELRQISDDRLTIVSERDLNERELLESARNFLEGQFGTENVRIWSAEDSERYDPQGRADRSIPFKPAIYVE
ncbi:MAG: leucine--tRNA ligase [Candidatus Hadarchaeota archaeon]